MAESVNESVKTGALAAGLIRGPLEDPHAVAGAAVAEGVGASEGNASCESVSKLR